MWVPPEAVRPGAPRGFSIEVNVDQEEPECADCYPHGNSGKLESVRPAEGGSVVIAPVPVYVIDKDGETVRRPGDHALQEAVEEAIPALPVRDDGVRITPSPGALLVKQKDLTPDDGCSTLRPGSSSSSGRRPASRDPSRAWARRAGSPTRPGRWSLPNTAVCDRQGR